jgi:hypothetical protein
MTIIGMVYGEDPVITGVASIKARAKVTARSMMVIEVAMEEIKDRVNHGYR